MKVEEENIREMEFGDAYDSVPVQVDLTWNEIEMIFFQYTVFNKKISFQDRDEFISDFGALFDKQETGTNCHFAMVLAKKY